MSKKIINKIKLAKWTTGGIALILLVINFSFPVLSKVIQLIHLDKIGWNMASYNPISLTMSFIFSISCIGLVFLEKGIHKTKIKSPTQWGFLALGGFGVLYSGLLLIIFTIKTLRGVA